MREKERETYLKHPLQNIKKTSNITKTRNKIQKWKNNDGKRILKTKRKREKNR